VFDYVGTLNFSKETKFFKLIIFLMFLYCFDVKNKFKKIKKIILM